MVWATGLEKEGNETKLGLPGSLGHVVVTRSLVGSRAGVL